MFSLRGSTVSWLLCSFLCLLTLEEVTSVSPVLQSVCTCSVRPVCPSAGSSLRSLGSELLQSSWARPHISLGTSSPSGIERRLCGLWFLRGTLFGWGQPSPPASHVLRQCPPFLSGRTSEGPQDSPPSVLSCESCRKAFVFVAVSGWFSGFLCSTDVGNVGDGKRNGCARPAAAFPSPPVGSKCLFFLLAQPGMRTALEDRSAPSPERCCSRCRAPGFRFCTMKLLPCSGPVHDVS